ncbi:MAG: coproporphyrinogen III oxidase [Alphaproteobacteria bacterium]|nr:coproporphyrinogen III oxidase [Alphaproteobacteria bacterium]
MSSSPLGLYVHWPFCQSKCPYCDFNSHVREHIDEARWRTALLAELDHAAADTPDRPVATVFFGGGTPSLMEPATVAAVIERIGIRWGFASDPEITLEANPGSVEAGRFRGYRAAGVNRLSLGVQALDDAALKGLGRGHSAAEAMAAIALAGAIFPRSSFDLIYARPGQTPAAWAEELDRAIAFGTGHLSLYQLTLEPGTQFHMRAERGDLVLPDEDTQAALFEATEERMTAAGFATYEVSNHARPGAASRHNLIYWRSDDHLGVGPGAHGRMTTSVGRRAIARHRAPETWLAAVERDGHGIKDDSLLTSDEAATEALLMGLRLDEGVSAERFLRATGQTLWDVVPADRIEPLEIAGFIARDEASLRATRAGRRVLNAVIAALTG